MISKEQFLKWTEKKSEVEYKDLPNDRHEVIDKDLPLSKLPFLDGKDDQLKVDLHGGGNKGWYTLSDTKGEEGAHESPNIIISNDGKGDVVGNSLLGTNIKAFGESFPKHLDALKDSKIDKVFSIACNVDGGGSPKFWEKLLHKPLKEAIITPPGHYGVAGQQFSNAPQHVLNKVLDLLGDKGGRGANQHVYERVDDKLLGFIPAGHHFEDKGEFHTKFDEGADKAMHIGLPAAGAIGIGRLAYSLYKRKKSEPQREQIKKKILENE